MCNFESIFLFLFIFSLLTVTRVVFRFIITLLHKNPEKIVYSDRVIIYLGLSVSYIITFLIKT